MKTLDRPGARVAYEVHGDGPAVILGHSLLCDGTMWEGVVPRLVERYRVINVDARGHRRSTAHKPFSLWDLAQDWLAILDAEGIDRAALVGLSMGGMTGMRLALLAPERVWALGLLDTNADPEAPANRVQYRVMAGISRRLGRPLRVFAPVVKKKFFGRTTLGSRPDLVEREMERAFGRDIRQVYWANRAVFDRESILERLPAIRCPTLVLVGEEDAATPPFRSERIATAIPGARLVRVPGAGHLSALEKPEEVSRVLRDFLDRVAPAAA